MSNGMNIDFDDLQITLDGMELTEEDEKKAVQKGIKILSKAIKNRTPKGKTERLSKLTETIKKEGFAMVGKVRTKAFWDTFQNFGTSQQKKNIGYFDKAIQESSNEALNKVANHILDKIR